MTAGAQQRPARPRTPAPESGSWSLLDQHGHVWTLLSERPALNAVPLLGAVLVEGLVSA